MMPKKLHPSVVNFKEFVRSNPKLILEVRKGKATWQELYEDWYLLGEDDSRWETVKSENNLKSDESTDKKGDWISTILGTVQKMDPEQVQHYINNLSQALGSIQGVLSQLQGSNKVNQVKQTNTPRHPFLFRKD
ncbi:MAG: hypothetical protein K0Q87_4623 [Neobacillus sp.]|jgi:hypothetical protein|nr:hypothetical protein [Neobacillus sp.]